MSVSTDYAINLVLMKNYVVGADGRSIARIIAGVRLQIVPWNQ
jgi:hypothetical protein